ncbi:MAG: UDP-N-acetylglucosamine 1-carboxyvinyltransferase [Armatimonadota bacterium]
MRKLLLTGGARLHGTVKVSGSKNSTLAILASALLAKGETILHNVPSIGDVNTMMEVLRSLGVKCERDTSGSVYIDSTDIKATEAPYELVKKMRASFCVLGPVLARKGYARVAMPGGCDIGARPIDFHVKGIQALGAYVNNDHGFVEAECSKLKGTQIYLNFPSAGATQHLMTTACLAEGVTTIHNAAAEPEILEVQSFLNAMGAKITGAGTSTVTIQGVQELKAVEYTVVPDRMEAGTWAVAIVATLGDAKIVGIKPEHVQPFVLKLREIGAIVDIYEDSMRVRCNDRPMATDIVTMPHPGFPTDLQQPFAALLSIAKGTSIITENVYERRFKYVDELRRMGADIKQEGRTAVINGVEKLTGAETVASDLRAGAALICAALAAEGTSSISGLEHVDRGYENLLQKLKALGAQVDSAPLEQEREKAYV